MPVTAARPVPRVARGGSRCAWFSQAPSAAVPSLEALLKSRHDVAAVITRPDAPAGRGLPGGRQSGRRAGGRGRPRDRSSRAGPRPRLPDQRLPTITPDCCPVTAYGALIPRAALQHSQHGWVNLHFSLLPAWRGAAPVAPRHRCTATTSPARPLSGSCPSSTPARCYGVLTEPVGDRTPPATCSAGSPSPARSLLVATLDGIESGQLEPGHSQPAASARAQAGHAGRATELECQPRTWPAGRCAPARPRPGHGRCSGTRG